MVWCILQPNSYGLFQMAQVCIKVTLQFTFYLFLITVSGKVDAPFLLPLDGTGGVDHLLPFQNQYVQ